MSIDHLYKSGKYIMTLILLIICMTTLKKKISICNHTLTMREKASVSELPEEETLSGLTRQSSTHSLADNA